MPRFGLCCVPCTEVTGRCPSLLAGRVKVVTYETFDKKAKVGRGRLSDTRYHLYIHIRDAVSKSKPISITFNKFTPYLNKISRL